MSEVDDFLWKYRPSNTNELRDLIYSGTYSRTTLKEILNSKGNLGTTFISPQVLSIIETYLQEMEIEQQEKEIQQQRKDTQNNIRISKWATIFAAISAFAALITAIISLFK